MKRLIIILIAFFCVGKIQAQQLPQITQYMINNYRELLTFIKFQKALQIIKERNKKL